VRTGLSRRCTALAARSTKRVFVAPLPALSTLWAYYPYSDVDVSGATLLDRSGNGRSATLVNSPTSVPGFVGGEARKFLAASTQRVQSYPVAETADEATWPPWGCNWWSLAGPGGTAHAWTASIYLRLDATTPTNACIWSHDTSNATSSRAIFVDRTATTLSFLFEYYRSSYGGAQTWETPLPDTTQPLSLLFTSAGFIRAVGRPALVDIYVNGTLATPTSDTTTNIGYGSAASRAYGCAYGLNNNHYSQTRQEEAWWKGVYMTSLQAAQLHNNRLNRISLKRHYGL
jgi:hypothetical protein